MKKEIISLKIITILIALFISISYVQAGGISVSPGSLNMPGVLKGGHAEATFRVGNPNDVPLQVGYQIDKDNIASKWITLNPNGSFILGPSSSKEVKLYVDIPKETPNGNYTTIIVIASKPLSNETGGAIVSAAVGLGIKIEVTGNEIKGIKVVNIKAQPSEAGYNAIFIETIENIGNVNANPVVKYEIWNSNLTQKYKVETKNLDAIAPYSTKDYSVETMSNELPAGKYILRITTYLDGKIVDSRDIPFTIAAYGTYSMRCNLKKVWMIPNKIESGEPFKIVGLINNSGEMPTTITLYAEIKKGDKLIGVESGEETVIGNGEIKNVTLDMPALESGDYMFNVWGNYRGKKTNVIPLAVSVSGFEFNVTFILIVSLALLAIIVLILFLLKRRKENENPYE